MLTPETGTSRAQAIRGWFGDGLLMLLVVFLLPVAILLVGAPIALLVRALIEIAHRF